MIDRSVFTSVIGIFDYVAWDVLTAAIGLSDWAACGPVRGKLVGRVHAT